MNIKRIIVIITKDNLSRSMTFRWKFNNGVQNLSSPSPIAINALGQASVNISSNYTVDAVYQTKAYVNTSRYNDSEYGVIIS